MPQRSSGTAGGLERRRTTPVAGAAVIALLVTVLMPLAPPPAGADSHAPVIGTAAARTTAVAAGGLGVVDVVVTNDVDVPTGTPVTLHFTLPPGVTIDTVTSPSAADAWACSAASCTLVEAATGDPARLDGEDSRAARVTVRLDPSVVVGAGLELLVAADATPVPGGAEADVSRAATTVTFPAMAPGQVLALDVVDDLVGVFVTGEPSTMTLSIRNLGPAALGGTEGSVEVSGILPPGSSAWQASGDGWSCPSPAATPECRWTGPAIPTGAFVPALDLQFLAPTELTTDETPIEWTRRVMGRASSGGDPAVVTTTLTAHVVPPPVPGVTLAADPARPLAVEAPANVDVPLRVSGHNLAGAVGTAAVTAALPAGFTFASVASPDAWTCEAPAAVLDCRRPADFGDQPVSGLLLTLAVAPDAPPGPTTLAFTARVDGEPADQTDDNGAEVLVLLNEPPPAGTTLRAFHYAEDGTAVPTDGSPYQLPPGRPSTLGLDAVNSGSSAISTGTRFTLELTLPAGTSAETDTDTGSPPWACSSSPAGDTTLLTCRLTTQDPLANDGALPRLRAALTVPDRAVPGPAVLPVSLRAEDADTARPELASTLELPAVVAGTAGAGSEDLSARAEVEPPPRAGGEPGTLVLAVDNVGDQRSRPVIVTATLPEGLALLDPLPDGCGRQSHRRFAVTVACGAFPPVQPAESIRPVELRVAAAVGATNPSPVTIMVFGPGEDEPRATAVVDVHVLAALVAVATATPEVVTNAAFGMPEPLVLLDGRASEAARADLSWRQAPAPGEPLVAFEGVPSGSETVTGPTASFRAPVVGAETTLHFELTVSDGRSTAVAPVEVVVRPVPAVPAGDTTGWEEQDQVQPSSLGAMSGFAAAAAAEPGWTWTRDPTVDLNRTGADAPVQGSRMTLVDNGEMEFSDPLDPPPDTEVAHEWFQCAPDFSASPPLPWNPDACASLGADSFAIPTSAGDHAVLRMVVSSAQRGIQTTREFHLGEIAPGFGDPRLIEPPFVTPHQPAVGSTLTADPGQWSLEHGFSFRWLRCPLSADAAHCADIPEAEGNTYLVTPDDIGHLLRVRVIAHALGEGNFGIAVSDATAEVPDDGAQPLVVTTDLPGGTDSIPNSASRTVHGSATGGRGAISLEWVQLSGPLVLAAPVAGPDLRFTAPATGSGDLVFQLTATDEVGTNAQTTITVTFGVVAVPGLLCEVLEDARSAGSDPLTISLGDAMRLTFAGATTTPGECSEQTAVDMTDATLDLFEWFQVTGLTVRIDPGGAHFEGGILRAPGDDTLENMDFRVVGGGLNIPFDLSGGDLNIAGAVIAGNLPFLHLPASWEAAAKISFASDEGVQTIRFDAVAWDTAAPGSPARVGDDLPVPPEGAPRLSLGGSASTDRSLNVTLTASKLVTFAGSGLTFTGSVARSAGGPTSVAASGALAEPVTLAPGLALASARLGWDGARFTGDGALEVSANVGRLSVRAGFDFADARDWSASLSASTASGTSWTPVSGLTLIDPTVGGSLSRLGPVTTFDLEVGSAAIEVGADAALTDLLLDLHARCDSSCTPVMEASGAVTVGVGSPPVTAAFTGGLDLGTGAFSISAGIADVSPFDGLTVESASFTMEGGAGKPTSVRLDGIASVFDRSVGVVIQLTMLGFVVSVELGDWLPTAGAPRFNGATIVYSSFDTTMTVRGETIRVPADAVLISARTGAPRWFTDLINTSVGQMTVVGDVDLRTREFSITVGIALPGAPLLFSVGGVSQTLERAGFRVESRAGRITTALDAEGLLTVPNFEDSASPSVLGMKLEAGYDPVLNAVKGSLTHAGDWHDAFGVPDLVVTDLTVQIEVSPAAATLGFGGAVTLPPAWAGAIGIVAGTPIRLVASVGGPTPCFGLEVGDPGSAAPVVDLANAGALTAKHLSIVIAPRGCSVGPHELAAGMSLFFDGSVLGTSVKVDATLRPTPLEFHADVRIGTIAISGFVLEEARVTVDSSALIQAVALHARANVLGVTAAVRGEFSKTATGATARITGDFASPELGGFQLDRLTATFEYVQSAGTRTMSASAEADVSVLGADQHVEFAFAVRNGRIEEASGTAAVMIPINNLTITGTGTFRLLRGMFPDITLSGQITVDEYTLSSLSGRLDAGGMTVDVSLDAPSGFATTPRLSGVIAWRSAGTGGTTIVNQAGQTVETSPGDFRFDARNVGLDVSGFGLLVDVTVAKVGGDFWAELAAGIDLGSGTVRVRGTFGSNGDFSLHAAAALRLAGFSLPSGDIYVTRTGPSVEVRTDITMAVPKLATVRFEGSFSRTPAHGLLYDLRGSAAIRPGGYDFGSGEYELFRRAGGASGMKARATVNVPGFASGAADLAIGSNGTLVLSAALNMNSTIGQVLGHPRASVVYLNSGSVNRFSFSVTVRNVMALPGYVYVSGTTSSSGVYSVSVSAVAGPWKDKTNLGVCRARYRAGGTFRGIMTGSASALTVSVDADLGVRAGCGELRVRIDVRVSFDYVRPNDFSLRVRLVLKFGGLGWKPTVYRS